MDEPSLNEKTNSKTQQASEKPTPNTDEKPEAKGKKNSKPSEKRNKKHNNEENCDKDETNSLPEKSHDYYMQEKDKNSTEKKIGAEDMDFFPNLEIKAPRKTESMYVAVCDIDKEIIKLFLSDKFGFINKINFLIGNSRKKCKFPFFFRQFQQFS